jgi:2-desacetyl-2-hydroxyethyl bacteriochlorophyllide A dehydrogenase
MQPREHIVTVTDVAGDEREVDAPGPVFEDARLEDAERRRKRNLDHFSHDAIAVARVRRRHRAMITIVLPARALWFVGPRRVEIAEVELPPVGDGEVLVRTVCSGISGGTELLAYRGEIDPDVALDESIGALGGTFRYPFRYGYSCVGVVEESRAGIAEGSLVFAFHPHQDRFVVAASELIALADRDPRAATLFPLTETALQIALDAGALLQEEVVLFGLGAVGLLTAVLLQRSGATVVAVEPLPWRRDAAASLGITAVTSDDVEGALSLAAREHGVPLAIEVSGRPEALALALTMLAHEGTALVASWYGTKQVTLPLGAAFHRRRLTIRSTQVSTVPARLADRWTPERRRAVTTELLDTLPLDAFTTHTFAFDDASDAFAAIDGGMPGLVHAAMWYS